MCEIVVDPKKQIITLATRISTFHVCTYNMEPTCLWHSSGMSNHLKSKKQLVTKFHLIENFVSGPWIVKLLQVDVMTFL